MKKLVLLITLLVLANQFFAYADAPPEPSAWTGNVQFGYSGTGGNTQDNNVSGKFNILYQKAKWTDSLKLDGLFSNNKESTTAERYAGTTEINYNFKKRMFVFARNNTIYDKFSAYDLSISNALGYGLRILDLSKFSVDVQAGPGYRDARIAGTQKHDDEITGYAASTINWAVSKTANLQEIINIETGEDNTTTSSQTSLTADIVGNLGMQTSFTVTHNSQIPAGSTKTKKTDYQTDVTFLFSF
jgi:putative salt-induced outer membrane protein